MWVCVIDRKSKLTAPGEPNGTVAGYSHGLAVKTGLQLPSASVGPNMVKQFGKNYLLTLPQRAMAGACTWSAPVQFLVDSRDSCDVEVTSRSCAAGSRLDAMMYAPSTGWGVATGPLVLREQAVSDITKTDVHFLCVDQPTSYIKSANASSKLVRLDTEFCFATNDTCRIVDECDFDPVTSAYMCPNDPVAWLALQSPPARCFFDNGFAIPPSPSFDAVAGVCHNAVVAVEYNFTWSGQTFTRLHATVKLANISVVANSANATLLSQDFVVTFVGNTSQTSVSNGSSSHSDMVFPASGNPGMSNFNYHLLSPIGLTGYRNIRQWTNWFLS